MTKTVRNIQGQERCGRDLCGHFHYLHGNGSKAHNLSTECVVAACTCGVFVEPAEVREPRTRPVKPLDRDDPKMFEL